MVNMVLDANMFWRRGWNGIAASRVHWGLSREEELALSNFSLRMFEVFYQRILWRKGWLSRIIAWCVTRGLPLDQTSTVPTLCTVFQTRWEGVEWCVPPAVHGNRTFWCIHAKLFHSDYTACSLWIILILSSDGHPSSSKSIILDHSLFRNKNSVARQPGNMQIKN